MSISLMFSRQLKYADHNTKEGGNSGLSESEFLTIMKEFPQFTCKSDTIFSEVEYLKFANVGLKDKDIPGFKNASKTIFILNYNDEKARKKITKESDWNYTQIQYSKWISASVAGKENYLEFKLFYDMAKRFNLNLLTYDTIITDSYLEDLRINEENRGIKLTKEQSHVLEYIDDQCRWFYIPTDEVPKILNILCIQPDMKDGDITSIIDDVQRENKVTIASFTGHTIIFGCNVPYIAYPDMQTYLAKEDHHTAHLQEVLNRLSKAFGTAAYFEYNNDDEQIASLAWSSKGKFVYGRFTSEGEGFDIFGATKKTMEVNQKSIIKTAKKLGMTPDDILTGMMKQKMSVRYFEQPHWYIESRLKM